MMFSRLRFQKGFTLTEVLIVIVVIAVMASIVMPRFVGQTDKAKAAEAIGIMGAIHRALLQYYDENSDYVKLDNLTAIEETLGISASTRQYDWEFSTDTNGTVTGTRGTNNTLSLSEDGTWDGSGQYDPEDGPYWPHLNQ